MLQDKDVIEARINDRHELCSYTTDEKIEPEDGKTPRTDDAPEANDGEKPQDDENGRKTRPRDRTRRSR
ncbi:MAG: hypothetical protein M1833_004736 [Piccolia ochrophora]|nr:MAG: hypothetical protein M1833_004736 [Piccolia ochrophora]